MKSRINILFLSLCVFYVFVSAVAQTVTTLAGSTQGFADGIGTSAQFYSPWGIAVTNDGSLIVADRANNCIRKVTPDGVVTTLAGSTTFGLADGMGAAAKFRLPASVALDANGFIYVADQFNHCIRKITFDGMVTTLAGSGVSGFVNGTGTQAQFSTPSGIAVVSDGSVFVADTGNHCIRKISPIGVVSTYTGSGVIGYMDGIGTAAQFAGGRGIAVAPDGTVFIGEFGNSRIRKINPLGIVSTFAGSGVVGFADGVGTAAQFNSPYDIDIAPDGTLLVAAYGNERIRKIAVDATVTTLAGSDVIGFADGPVTTAQFYGPSGVALAPDGTLYIVDSLNNRIRKISNALSANEFELKSQVTLFPNPSDGLFQVDLTSLVPNEVTYAVYDILGKKLTEKKVSFENSSFEINLVDYPAGVYQLRISIGETVVHKKLVRK